MTIYEKLNKTAEYIIVKSANETTTGVIFTYPDDIPDEIISFK